MADDLVGRRREDHLQLLRGPAPGAAGGHGPHLEPRGRPALRPLLLPDLMLDMDRAREVFEGSEDFTVGIEEEFQILDPQTLDLVQRFEELQEAAQVRSAARGVDHRRADRVGDRDPVGQGRDVRGRGRATARRAPAPLPPRGGARSTARRHRHAPVEPVAGAADHRHRALPPPRGGPEVRRLAEQHVLAARPRGRARRGPGHRRVRPPARPPARPARPLGELAVPRRAGLRAALRADADLHEELPALRRARAVRRLARATRSSPTSSSGRTRSSSTRSSGGASARTTISAPSSSGSATRSPTPRTRPRWRA